MDWATFLKDYSIPVTAVVGLGMAILGYYFGKWDSERKRKWELDDREFNRRVETYDMRIRETRDYIDTWSDYADFMWFIQIGIVGEKDLEKIDKELSYFRERFPGLPDRVQKLSNKSVSLDLLNDAELTNLKKELILTIRPLTENIEALEKLSIKDRLLVGKTFEIQNMTPEEFINLKSKVYKIVTKMKARLDKLSKEATR